MDRLYNWFPRDLLLTAIALFAWGIGEGMFIYFQPLYLEKLGANPIGIGAILSMMGIAMTVAQAPAGYLADRVGARPVMWASWVLGTIAAVLMALANSLPMFVAGMLTYGLTSFVVAPMNSYITTVRGRWKVERALTVVNAIYHLGAVAGPLLGGFVGQMLGLKNVYRISAAVFLVSTLIILQARKPHVEESGEVHIQPPSLTTNPRFMGLLALVILTMFALYLPQPLTPNYLQNQLHFSLETIGQLGAAGSLGNAGLMLALGHLSAPVGLIVGQAFVGLFALIMWQSSSLPVFFLGYFLLGGYRLARSMALAYARSLVKIQETGFAYGLVETGNAISTIIAPLVAGFLYEHNPISMYIASLAAVGITLLINIGLLPKLRLRQPAPSKQQMIPANPSAVEHREKSQHGA